MHFVLLFVRCVLALKVCPIWRTVHVAVELQSSADLWLASGATSVGLGPLLLLFAMAGLWDQRQPPGLTLSHCPYPFTPALHPPQSSGTCILALYMVKVEPSLGLAYRY